LFERELLLAFKYGGKTYIGKKIARIMADRLKAEDYVPEIIIPVPMHMRKRRKRGYNQAEIIARHLSKELRVAYSADVLLRTFDTSAMSKLAPEERRINIENAFSVALPTAERIEGKSVLLVDDIYTTGSTASACAGTLMTAGARSVRVVSFASGANLLYPTGFSS